MRANILGPEKPLKEIKSGSDMVRHVFQDYSSDDRKDPEESTRERTRDTQSTGWTTTLELTAQRQQTKNCENAL